MTVGTKTCEILPTQNWNGNYYKCVHSRCFLRGNAFSCFECFRNILGQQRRTRNLDWIPSSYPAIFVHKTESLREGVSWRSALEISPDHYSRRKLVMRGHGRTWRSTPEVPLFVQTERNNRLSSTWLWWVFVILSKMNKLWGRYTYCDK
jgi:hypothetical protein